MHHSNCKCCGGNFTVQTPELHLLKKLSAFIVQKFDGDNNFALPAPSLCSDCRQQRRLAMRNQRQFSIRHCDLCGNRMICVYSPDKPFQVYCPECFWSDKWNALDYGTAFDPGEDFIVQLKRLFDKVPKLGMMILGENENSDYTNDNYKLKDCYLVFDGEQSRECYFGETFSHLTSCIDFLALQHSELCYQCINSSRCYQLFYSNFCHNCSTSWFLIDCIGCRDCFACSNLKNKQYCFFNEQLNAEEYTERISSLNLGSYQSLSDLRLQAEQFFAQLGRKHMRGIRNEGCSGDNLDSCKDCFDCYDCSDCRDCGFGTNLLMGANDCLDYNMWGDNASLIYNSTAVGASAQNIFCSYYVYSDVDSILYSIICSRGSRNLLGCVGLRHAEHCILNKQYSKNEYEQLLKNIIQQLIKNNNWGEFFPAGFSSFGYNETVAQEFFPLNKEQALGMGYSWSNRPSVSMEGDILDASCLSDDIRSVSDQILHNTIRCEVSGKLFKLQRQELEFYRRFKLPLPRRHPDQRHLDRMARRNPRFLWKRKCSVCLKEIHTSYAPSRTEKILCTECYSKEYFL